jgi:two-component system chemotaxis response regulator CheV
MVGNYDNALLSLVDQKTKLAGSNKMELLLFKLGGRETFGINVFKVREVCEAPEITRAPNMPHGVDGIISLRGNIILQKLKCFRITSVGQARNK